MTKLAQRPVGIFVHHQGKGHATRISQLVCALPPSRPVTIFCARDDIFADLPRNVDLQRIPSLFEPTGDETAGMDWVHHPETLHCAPLGWPSIREAMGRIAAWFATADPALMISDVSAEIAQLARICSVPHVMVRQHGRRGDPGHIAAYTGAAGILAPFHADLAQPDWHPDHVAKTFFVPGLGLNVQPEPAPLPATRPYALIVSGGGGTGFAEAPLAVAARAVPELDWITVGTVQRDWHATPPGNLRHMGWVDDVARRIAGAEVVIASTGNTTCQQVLSAARPWLAVPEWRYFDEQICKAEALARAGAATHLPHLPSSAQDWQAALSRVRAEHAPERQRRLTGAGSAEAAAAWIEDLIRRLWSPAGTTTTKEIQMIEKPTVSVLTLARGRSAHLTNVVRGLARQTVLPDELVVGVMQKELYDLPEAPFPIRQIRVGNGQNDELPLAQARNRAASEARGDLLVFLDVDCIPHPELVADYVQAAPNGGLIMGEVMYLPAGATDAGVDFAAFDRVAQRHSDRRGPPDQGVAPCEDYRCFWSLNFAIGRADWERSGGFDIAYTGYGGEDTDFGRTLSELGMPLWWTRGARVYHQHHPHAMPPVHHLRSVLRNADVFAAKWGHRTMEHWLHAFRLMGLIEKDGDGLRVVREPGPDDFALCNLQSHEPFATTRRVIDILQGVEGDDAFGRARVAEVERQQADLLGIAAE